MVDPFVIPIQNILLGKGYPFVYLQASPARREYVKFPAVLVATADTPEVKYHAFGAKNIRSAYDLEYMQSTGDANVSDNGSFDFVIDMVATFLPIPESIEDAGAWQIKVDQIKNIDRGKIPEQYAISTVRLIIDWIQDY